MFQKIAIVASITKGFTDFQQISIEIILNRNDVKTIINSGFMQLPENKETVFNGLEIGSLSRKHMLSSIWYKGRNDGEVCLFEFMDKSYQQFEMDIGITNHNVINKQHLVQLLKEGHFIQNAIEYTVKFSDM